MGNRHLYWILTGPSFAVWFRKVNHHISNNTNNTSIITISSHSLTMRISFKGTQPSDILHSFGLNRNFEGPICIARTKF
jgi:hypothetical protein